MIVRKLVILLSASVFLYACQGNEQSTSEKLFELISSEDSGIDFTNQVENTKDFNIFSYRNFYNGGGVSLGDINNDGLPDVYLTNNMGDNKLYLNQGEFKFRDITAEAGVSGTKAWSTGVVMVDINNDGRLDIYVCNAGYVEGDDQENELFINQGISEGADGSVVKFTENASEYGLNQNGYTTHAAFFDYDMDGDLDCYILNNSFMPVNTLNYSNKRELYAEDWPVRDFLKGGGDKLLRNDDGRYNDVTREAGIYGSLIGFGLGITIGDINDDHLPDMYVSNDFFEHDYLYVNQGDGTFKEDIRNWVNHISLFSMGADMADINNDGYPEVFVTDMLPDDDERLKTTTVFENYNVYLMKQQRDFYQQFMHNTLQYNNQNGSFSEIAFYSGVSSSDWSWGALLFDADNDGYRDIYVSNGIYQEVTNQDFIDFFANDVIQKLALTGEKEEMDQVFEKMPSTPIVNKAFKNLGNLKFEDSGEEWGFTVPSFSNGASYGDLDLDGDLDLIVNNLNQQAFVYKNNSESKNQNNFLKVLLKGPKSNTFAIGSKVFVYVDSQILNFQMIPTRGFQSSIDYNLVFGLHQATEIDSVKIIWPDRQMSLLNDVNINQQLVIDYEQIEKYKISSDVTAKTTPTWLVESDIKLDPHKEDVYYDFFQEGLVIKMLSKEGPSIVVGDLNGDQKDDIVIGGANGQSMQLYIQQAGQLNPKVVQAFEQDSSFEDTASALFDADNDGDLDLFIGSGGNHFLPGHPNFQDRLYLNDGQGNFIRSPNIFAIDGMNTAVIVPWDFDGDNDMDLFIGSRSVPGIYGINPRHYLYQNDGKGNFSNVIRELAPSLEDIGMITDARLVDLVGDSSKELVITGEWMGVEIFEVGETSLQKVNSNLSEYKGWWYTVEGNDVDNDGDFDLILGNRGENFYFNADRENPTKIWISDFDFNGSVEKIITRTIKGRDMPVSMKKELTEQIVSLKKQNLKHIDYAGKSIQDLFPEEILNKALLRQANYYKSVVALNDGSGQFSIKELPAEVQFAPIYAIHCIDINNDGLNDLIMGGNDSGYAPQFSRLDASRGHVLINQDNGIYQWQNHNVSGFFVEGDLKDLHSINIGNETYLITVVNDRTPKLFKIAG